MIRITNMEAAFAAMDKWLKDVERISREAAIALTMRAFRQALDSPQYSGDFVANWKLSVNTIDSTFQRGIFPQMEFPTKNPFHRGDVPAMMYAVMHNTGKLDGVRLGDKLWLANSAAHDDVYAWKIENNLMKLRPENFGGDGPLRRVHEYIRTHFSRIDKHNMSKLR